MTNTEDALASFRGGFTCSSAVFSAFSEELDLSRVFRLSKEDLIQLKEAEDIFRCAGYRILVEN